MILHFPHQFMVSQKYPARFWY